MPAEFLDSNVLLYLASSDAAKAERAEGLVASGGVVSVQVLNEIASFARRRMGLSWPETRAFLEPIRHLLDVVPLTEETHACGLDMAERYGLSLYDGMIVASALLVGCERLWSEDMHDGLVVESRVTIANPFRD